MKKFFVLLAFVAGMLAGNSWADGAAKTVAKSEKKAVAVATPDTVVVDCTMDGDSYSVTLNVDQDYSWKTTVEGAGLKSGSDEYNMARLNCIAAGKAFDAYKLARSNDQLETAEANALTSVVRGWMEWRKGGLSFGTYEDETGFKYDLNATADQLNTAEAFYKKADKYAAAATKLGQHDADKLVARIQSSRDAIDGIKKYQAEQAKPKKHKKAKAKPAADADAE